MYKFLHGLYMYTRDWADPYLHSPTVSSTSFSLGFWPENSRGVADARAESCFADLQCSHHKLRSTLGRGTGAAELQGVGVEDF
jgi:hypothetical protein